MINGIRVPPRKTLNGRFRDDEILMVFPATGGHGDSSGNLEYSRFLLHASGWGVGLIFMDMVFHVSFIDSRDMPRR